MSRERVPGGFDVKTDLEKALDEARLVASSAEAMRPLGDDRVRQALDAVAARLETAAKRSASASSVDAVVDRLRAARSDPQNAPQDLWAQLVDHTLSSLRPDGSEVEPVAHGRSSGAPAPRSRVLRNILVAVAVVVAALLAIVLIY